MTLWEITGLISPIANGQWKICNLTNGTYTVCEVLKNGWTQTSLPVCHTVALAGINITNINFTNQRLMCISGYKLDNCNGALPDWNVTISNSTGYTSTKTTGLDGRFEFCGLASGVYTLTETLKPGWIKVSSPP